MLLLQADSATQKQLDLVRMTENSKRTLEQEVSAYRSVKRLAVAQHFECMARSYGQPASMPCGRCTLDAVIAQSMGCATVRHARCT